MSSKCSLSFCKAMRCWERAWLRHNQNDVERVAVCDIQELIRKAFLSPNQPACERPYKAELRTSQVGGNPHHHKPRWNPKESFKRTSLSGAPSKVPRWSGGVSNLKILRAPTFQPLSAWLRLKSEVPAFAPKRSKVRSHVAWTATNTKKLAVGFA